ncbi:MAG TPA: hypothetical protein VJ962_02845 [Clostridia bacterium]|nr:hypothetical protein [Clostridia bacterium]
MRKQKIRNEINDLLRKLDQTEKQIPKGMSRSETQSFQNKLVKAINHNEKVTNYNDGNAVKNIIEDNLYKCIAIATKSLSDVPAGLGSKEIKILKILLEQSAYITF